MLFGSKVPRLIRRFFRRRMQPLDVKDVVRIKTKISLVYFFMAFNAAALVMYQIAKGNKHWPTTMGLTNPEIDTVRPALWFAHKLGVDRADVYTINGFNITKTHIDTAIHELPPEKVLPEPKRIDLDEVITDEDAFTQ